MNQDSPFNFARAPGGGRTASTTTAELRQHVDVDVLRALDAIARSKGVDRHVYINSVLSGHVNEMLHEASLVVRQLWGNPLLTEALGAPLEFFEGDLSND